jgi:hypothetical protein
MVLVDSSVWIEALRGNGDVNVKLGIEGLLDAYEAWWCGPVKLEVMGGARKSERNRLAFFFQPIPYRDVENEVWSTAVRLSWNLRDKGVTVPWNDILIASLAMAWDCRLYAHDRHFHDIARSAPLRLYQPGYGGRYSPT